MTVCAVMYIPVVQLDVRISDWVVLEPHEVEVEHWGELHKHHSLLSLLYFIEM